MKAHAICLGAALLVAAIGFPARAQDSPEVERLKITVEALQQTVQELQGRIAVLEQEKGTPARQAEGNSPVHLMKRANFGGSLPPPGGVQPAPASQVPETSPIPDYHTFSDQQVAAPRPDNRPMDPSLKGFIPIPGTVSMIKIGGSARVDAIENFGNIGNPNLFVPSSMPVEGQTGYGGPNAFAMQAKGTRLTFEFRRPMPGGDNLRIFYENDFFGDSSSPGMAYRVRHFYGQGENFLVGQTFTGFMNIDAWPDTLDYQGPNALVNARQPQVRFIVPATKKQHVYFSLEQPSANLSAGAGGLPSDASPLNRWPDFALGYRYEGQGGHVQLSGMARSIGYQRPAGFTQSVFGWGLNLTGSFTIAEGDKLSYQVAYGEGIGKYINDTSGLNLDAALDAMGQLKPVFIFAPIIGLSHQWSERWRTTVTYGYTRVNPVPSMGPLALHSTQYASLNLVWQPTKSARVGLEYLYGTKETMNGARGTANRLNFVIKYDLVK